MSSKEFLTGIALAIFLITLQQDLCNGQRSGRRNPRRSRPTRIPRKNRNFTSNINQLNLSSNCSIDYFPCRNGKCVERSKVCDGVDSCGDNSDERRCKMRGVPCWYWQTYCINGWCGNGTFQCNNGKCINTTDVCDKIDHCGDRSDEIRFETGFKCPIGRGGDICVLPQRHVNDSYSHCNNNADESMNIDRQRRLFGCFDRSGKLSNGQLCDGIIDCPDLSDECPCERGNTEICRRFCDQTNASENCTFGSVRCENGIEISRNQVCDGIVDCVNGIDEKYCSKHSSNDTILCAGDIYNKTQKVARLCDGRPECFDLSDECNSRCQPALPGYCNITIVKVPLQYSCTTSTGQFNLTVEHICDGEWSPCSPRVTEEESGCAGRHYCNTTGDLISVDKSLRCNGFIDCIDESDEENCTDRYSCSGHNRLRSVPMQFVLDGVRDCRNADDECPRTMDDMPLASRRNLLELPFFQGWVWVVGLACIFGNATIIASKVWKFKSLRKADKLAKINHFLIFNLATADCTMGIYLLGIAIKHVMTSGRYCDNDVRWRTGPVCFWLGATAVVSSEASLFMLTLLTSLRLFSVHYPIKIRAINLKWIPVAVVGAWVWACVIGFLPHLNISREAFTSGGFIKSKFISTPNINLQTAHQFAISLSRVARNATAVQIAPNWYDIDRYLTQNFRRFSIQRYYGYYSQYSVCMPNFYVTTDQKMWGYSFAIILVNFLIFIYISVAYALIYRKATRSDVTGTGADERRVSMQKKIVRIVISNLLCWIPICIIAFLNITGGIVAGGNLYAVTAIVILPINSVLNPSLYSNMVDILWEKLNIIRNCLPSGKMSHMSSKNTQSSNLPQDTL